MLRTALVRLFEECRIVSSTLDRLRRLQELRPKRNRSEAPLPPSSSDAGESERGRAGGAEPLSLEEAAPGVEVVNAAGRCYMVEHRYPAEERRGGQSLACAMEHELALLGRLYPSARLEPGFDLGQAAFIDTETSGLGVGAGVYAFMVGVGRFEQGAKSAEDGPEFVVRQFFMRHPGEEPAMLLAVAENLAACRGLVTFNGRTFDAPLLRSRYQMNRPFLPAGVETPPPLAEDAPHLDLLHPARRIWRRRLGSCALSNLERRVLGHLRSEADVPGSLIPALYMRFLQEDDASEIGRVFYHNLEDIVSMAALAGVVCGHFADPLGAGVAGVEQGEDLFALACIHVELGQVETAEALLRHALERIQSPRVLADAFHELGLLLKRQERWDDAVAVWERWLTTVPGPDPRPYVELAKHHEWRTGDLGQAEIWTAWALHNQEQLPARQQSRQVMDELTHRLERLRRKSNHTAAT